MGTTNGTSSDPTLAVSYYKLQFLNSLFDHDNICYQQHNTVHFQERE